MLQAAILVPVIAFGLASAQKARFGSSSQALINRESLASALTGTPDPNASEIDFNRIVQTQAQIAVDPRVPQRVVRSLGLRALTATQLAGETSVTTDPNTNIITISVTDRSRSSATALASAYVEQFITYSGQLDAITLNSTRRNIEQQLGGLRPKGQQAQQLKDQLKRVQNLLTLGNTTASLLRTGQAAIQVEPKPVRDGVIGLLVGIILGVALAFGFELLDTRLRSSSEIEGRLGWPILGRIPAPPKACRENDSLALLEEPDGPQAENFRILRNNLSFADLDHTARSIMVTSAIESEGKSTTIANLAVSIASAGRHVILVDLDFRRPYVERFFDLPRSPGATSVLLGQVTLTEALTSIPLPLVSTMGLLPSLAGNGHGPAGDRGLTPGRLDVLPTGDLPPSPGELVVSEALHRLLDELSSRCDILLIDAPPMLHVGDAMALCQRIDAVLIVTRLGVVRGPMLDEVQRLLGTSPARVLGVIVTDATRDPGLRYGDYYYGSGSYGGASTSSGASRA